MLIHRVLITQLLSDPANARKHNDQNLDAIKNSLGRFGQQKPIVIDSNNVVRAGNGTLQAAKALGWTQIDVVKSDLPISELTAFAIADNRTAELAEWDNQMLAPLATDGQLADLGFNEKEIDRILDQHDPKKGDDEPAGFHQAFEVVVECRDEAHQQEVFERLSKEGLPCRLFTL